MKEWKKPVVEELDIMQTAHGNGNGKDHGRGHGYDDGPGMGPGNGNGFGHNGGNKWPGDITPPGVQPGWGGDSDIDSMS